MAERQEQPEQLREADRTLAARAWKLVWNRKAPVFAALGIATVFTLRALVCRYETPYPVELDFEWYGEHCGPGHGDPGRESIDELDEACRRHDEAYLRAQEIHETGPSR